MQPLLLVLFGILIFVSSTYGADKKVLIVGKELWKETLPLQMGNRWYVLQGLKSYTWYEVKISYPASISAKFAIQLKKDDSDSWRNPARRLLNTEKLIFKTNNFNDDQAKYYVLLTVEPEGFVAIPHVPESQEIMYNIDCHMVVDLTSNPLDGLLSHLCRKRTQSLESSKFVAFLLSLNWG